jgi:LPXTG-motif cell wall-anchored protein
VPRSAAGRSVWALAAAGITALAVLVGLLARRRSR